jgi:hypothetical protein
MRRLTAVSIAPKHSGSNVRLSTPCRRLRCLPLAIGTEITLDHVMLKVVGISRGAGPPCRHPIHKMW